MAEPPRGEPEIIPPGADWRPGSRVWIATARHRGGRLHIAKLGPLGILLAVLMAGIIAAAALVFLAGAVLIGAVAAAALVAGAIISGIFRRPLRR